MSDIIARESQLLSQDALVVLYELDVRRWNSGILRFTNNTQEGPLWFNGYDYQPFPIKADGFAWNGSGSPPKPKLSVSALDPTFEALLISADNLTGAPVKRIRTYAKCLDNGTDPDPEATFPIDVYRIERIAEKNTKYIVFELSTKLDQRGRMIPGRQCIRDTCTHRYRYWDGEKFSYDGVTCPYTGDAMYDIQGQPVSDPAEDMCSKGLTDGCKLRFGENGNLPTRAFPGLARYRS